MLDQRLVGQLEARRLVLTLGRQHREAANESPLSIRINRNVLLIGPAGTGKTCIPQGVCDALGLPLAIVDAAGFGTSRIQGRPLDEIFGEMLQAAGNKLSQAEKGVLLLENLDHLLRLVPEAGRDLQQAWVQLMNGRSRMVATTRGTQVLASSGWWIIGSGTFEGLGLAAARRQNQHTIGFQVGDPKSALPRATAADLIALGMLPALVARLPFICELHPFKPDDLLAISCLDHSAVGQWVLAFRRAGVSLELTEDARRDLARQAEALKLGAHGLQAVLGSRLGHLIARLPEFRGRTQRVVVDLGAMLGESAPKIIAGPPLFPLPDEAELKHDSETEDWPPDLQELFPPGVVPARPARIRQSSSGNDRLATLADLRPFLEAKP